MATYRENKNKSLRKAAELPVTGRQKEEDQHKYGRDVEGLPCWGGW